MFKKIVAGLLLAAMLLTIIPFDSMAGENVDAVTELDRKNYILQLVGTDGAAGYRSGALLSANMNAGQMEDCLQDFLNTDVEGVIKEMEDLATYGELNETNGSFENMDGFEQVTGFLTQLRQVRVEVKGCYDIISEDRAIILSGYEALEKGTFTTEHDKESIANQIITKAQELEKHMGFAAESFEKWTKSMNGARNRLITANGGSATGGDEIQKKIVRLKTGRAEEMQNLAAREPKTAGKDIVIDVVSIHEIRIYALDKNEKPLTNATIYCWNADESIPNPSKGTGRRTNSEGYVTVPIAELGADENYYLTAGYEITCPGYRTQYAQANYIQGGEIFWNHLEENDPNEDVYVAGISLNGYDCKWYEKALYITDENKADQKVELFLRSQSGKEFSGTAEMKYANRNPETAGSEYSTLSGKYSSTGGAASVVFTSKLCQNIAGNQENAMTFTLSTSRSNDEIKPLLKSEDAKIEKTQFVQDDAILDALYFGQISLAWPGDVPFLNGMSLNFDIQEILGGHIYGLTNCSGLWAVIGSTTQKPMTKTIEELNNKWQTADSQKIDKYTKEQYTEVAGFTKQEVENEYKDTKYRTKTPGLYGGKQIYGSASLAVCGSYEPAKEMTFGVDIGVQIGFRGDWTKQFFLGPFPVSVGWGFDFSASAFFKFQFKGWEYNGTDISLAFRILGYMSGGPGVSVKILGKTFQAGLGFRFQLAIMLGVPIFQSTAGPKDDPKFTFNIGLSFYIDVFFVHYVWNLWSGIGEWNLRTGDFKFTSKPFWEGDNSALKAAAGENPTDGTDIEDEIHLEDEINGDTIWPYKSYPFANGADDVPTYFTVHWEGSREYKSDRDYIYWVEDGKTVKYILTNFDGSDAGVFPMPKDIQEKLDSGEWRVRDVRAATTPYVYYVDRRYFDHDVTEQVQIATVTVTIGTDWITQTDVIDGKEVTKEVPTGTVVITRMYLYDGDMKPLQYVENNSLHDVVFINKIDQPVRDALGMVYSVILDGWSPAGQTQIEEDIVLVPSSAKPICTFCTLEDVASTGEFDAVELKDGWNLAEDTSNGKTWNTELRATETGLVYFVCGDLSGNIVPTQLRGGNLPDGNPVKMLMASDGQLGLQIVLMEDGSVWTISPDHAVSSKVTAKGLSDNIGDIALVRTSSEENKSAYYTLFCTPKATEGSTGAPSAPLQSVVLDCEDGYAYEEEVTDYDVDINGAPIFAGPIMNENYLYWFETFEDPETGANRMAVRAACYSPEYNMITSPYRIGVLDGNDGEIPDGYLATSAPVCSLVTSNGDMIITKSWIPDTNDESTDKDPYLSTYNVSMTRRVANELMGAGSEKPAVSAGRDTNMLFTIINKGNVPVLGFDFNIYHKNKQGVQELVQTSHIDITDQSKNKVTYLKKGYSAAPVAIFEGEYAAHRTSGLFDMINGDEWNITRFNSKRMNGDGSVFVSVPALMPEGIQTYTMVFAVPIDWENKTEITCAVEKSYVPKYVADIFALSEKTGATNENRAKVPVLAVSRAGVINGELPKGVGDVANIEIAGTLNGFSEAKGENMLVAGSLLDKKGKPMSYTFTPGIKDVHFDTVNLSISGHVFEKNDEKYVTLIVSQEGQTDNIAPRGVTLQSFVDGEEFPSYTYTFTTHHDDGKLVYNMTLPEKTLTGGRNADRLAVRVSDTVEENEEMSMIDNICYLELNETLIIAKQPEDCTVIEEKDAIFSVKAEGGERPYTYTWQKYENGQWTDISGQKGSTLTIKKTTVKMNGLLIRCIVEDAAGNKATSETATLTIKEKIPPTGDANNTNGWTLMLVISLLSLLAAGVVVKRKYQKR